MFLNNREIKPETRNRRPYACGRSIASLVCEAFYGTIKYRLLSDDLWDVSIDNIEPKETLKKSEKKGGEYKLMKLVFPTFYDLMR